MARTIEVSSGCTTSADTLEPILPGAVTTLSIGISPIAARAAANMLEITQTIRRAERGTGAATTAADGDPNSRIAATAGSCRRIARSDAFGERGEKSSILQPLPIDMTVLLRPELAVDGTAVEKQGAAVAVDHPALLQNQDLVALRQG